ncbi:MAG TPA: hypothetical protein VFT74_17995 [Isosphaeraceae bacterium]|nr:hypothetical protein [Isosphaeraceae bacterium]
MGHWGVKSYEIDEADEALDSAFEQVHGSLYEELMDDRNPMTPEQIHKQLANAETLDAAVRHLHEMFGDNVDEWDEVERLAFAGVVVRHAELGVAIPQEWRSRAVEWLESEEIEWDEATKRRLRKAREIETLSGSK